MKHGAVDGFQADLVRDLQRMGITVAVTSDVGGGFPDMVLGKFGVTDLAENKVGNAPYTPAQIKFHAEWKGRPILTFRSYEEGIRWGMGLKP